MSSRRQAFPSSNRKMRVGETSLRPASSLSKAVLNESKERKPTTPGSTEEEGTSIQVAIRCRRRSTKEVDEKSPVVVTFSKDVNQSVTVELASTTSTFGVVSLPPTRTYSFDTVFGPDADQATVYNDVVAPMLDEVLQGYNCTLFAYGQTGTGKTYTMQGDLNLSPLGNPVANAGMMPRVITNLYHRLESTGADFSIKISYIELYNEELRDLLSHEINEGQEMGSETTLLKIYDDAGKRGIIIQGLEEVLVKDAASAIKLLVQGSHRRQVAVTKFNDHSSRSHAVFSITVHIRESSSVGDDLLRTGKFNLVDLAGSENIGRSGAENKRAREAGMINQSLLSLGRVINALVEKSSYIPYRESKLTRILQDSLGGRTKTKIITTISPAHSNVEETLSALEYALRAKSIQNKPEINQRMSRNALLKDYVTEIERLKVDLVSAREKNGMYLSNETWDQLSAEKEQMQIESEAAKKEVTSITSQLNALREEFEHSMTLLMKRDSELDQTKQILKKKSRELGIAEDSLKTLGESLRVEVSAREALQISERTLDGVAKNLKRTVQASIADLEAIFSKLERSTLFSENKLQVAVKACVRMEDVQDTIVAEIEKCSLQNSLFLGQVNTAQDKLRYLSEQFVLNNGERIESNNALIMQTLEDLESQGHRESEAFAVASENVRQMLSSVREEHEQTTKHLQSIGESIIQELADAALQNSTIVMNLMQSNHNSLKSTLDCIRKGLDQHFGLLEHLACSSHRGLEEESARLQQQNEWLQQQISEIRSESVLSQEKLAKDLVNLVTNFTEENRTKLESTTSAVERANDEAIAIMRKSSEQLDADYKTVLTGRTQMHQFVESGLSDAEQRRIDNIEEAGRMKVAVGRMIATSKADISSLNNLRLESAKRSQDSEESCFSELYEIRASKKARIEQHVNLLRTSQEQNVQLGDLAIEATRNIMDQIEATTSTNVQFGKHLNNFAIKTRTSVGSLRKTSQALKEKLLVKEPITGSTPQKRKWCYPQSWETISHVRQMDRMTPAGPLSTNPGSDDESDIINLGVVEFSTPSHLDVIQEFTSGSLSLPPASNSKQKGSKLPGPKERLPLNAVHNGMPGRFR